VMAADLAAGPSTDLRVQLCGDAHLSNFGLFASPDRRTLFDMNDFDETHPGPFEWDLKRLCASAAVCARVSGHSRGAQRRAALGAASGYRETIRRLASVDTLDAWYFRVEFDQIIPALRTASVRRAARDALVSAERRTSMQAFRKLTTVVDGRRRIVADPPLVVPVPDDASADEIERLRAILAGYRESLDPTSARLFSRFRTADVARKVVGVGSVGTRALIVLFQGGDGEPLFLQVKEAGPSVLAPFVPGVEPPANQGRRVVDGQRLIQGSSDVLLGWTSVTGGDGRVVDFYVRQLRDRKGSVEPALLDAAGLAAYGRLCGAVLARAHARSGDAAAISGYLGGSDAFDDAVAAFALAYADQTVADHERLLAAIGSGAVEARPDV
jgi:uncharacterized protein (DUF2252 family)